MVGQLTQYPGRTQNLLQLPPPSNPTQLNTCHSPPILPQGANHMTLLRSPADLNSSLPSQLPTERKGNQDIRVGVQEHEKP